MVICLQKVSGTVELENCQTWLMMDVTVSCSTQIIATRGSFWQSLIMDTIYIYRYIYMQMPKWEQKDIIILTDIVILGNIINLHAGFI